MPVRSVLQYPDPGLKVVAELVSDSEFESQELQNWCQDLKDTAVYERALGLASTQIGWSKRVFVMVDYEGEKPRVGTFVNPRILSSSGAVFAREGCISFRGFFWPIKAPESVLVEFQDDNGMGPHVMNFDGMMARCIYHETQHLDGNTMVDRLHGLDRSMFLKAYGKHVERHGTT